VRPAHAKIRVKICDFVKGSAARFELIDLAHLIQALEEE
jgi:hypothetical protein